MERNRPFPLILVMLALFLWVVPPRAGADRIGTPYRGPVELLGGGSGGEQDTGEPAVPDSGGDSGGGDSGGGDSGGGDSGGGQQPAPGGGGGSTGGGGGNVAKLDGQIVWQWWWEYSKEPYLAQASERGRVNMGSSYYWFGSGAKFPPRDIVSPSDAQRHEKVFAKLKHVLLSDSSAEVRDTAAIALGRVGYVAAGEKEKKEGESDNLVVRALIEAAEKDVNPMVRTSALLALGMTRDKDAGAYLVRSYGKLPAAEKPYANIALGLARYPEAIRHLVDQLPTTYTSKSDDQIAAITGLGLFGPGAVPAIKEAGGLEKLEKLLNGRGNDPLVVQAVRAVSLLQVDRKGVEKMASSPSPDIKWAAILSLANYTADEKDAESAAKTLEGRKCFASGDNQDKSYSMIALGRLAGGLDPNSKLRAKILKFIKSEALESRKNNYTRSCAALAVGLADDRTAIPEVAALLTDTTAQNHVISAACVTLGLLRATEHAETIKNEVMRKKSWNDDTRGYAALGIALMGDTTQLKDLKDFAHSSSLSDKTKRQLPLALGLLGDRQDIRELVQFFSKNWKKNERYEVSNAAFGLSWIKDQGAVDQLIQIIDKANEPEVRGMAVIALGYTAAQERISPLSELYQNLSHRNRFANWDILWGIAGIL